jgi:hypothetical protein
MGGEPPRAGGRRHDAFGRGTCSPYAAASRSRVWPSCRQPRACLRQMPNSRFLADPCASPS